MMATGGAKRRLTPTKGGAKRLLTPINEGANARHGATGRVARGIAAAARNARRVVTTRILAREPGP